MAYEWGKLKIGVANIEPAGRALERPVNGIWASQRNHSEEGRQVTALRLVKCGDKASRFSECRW